MILIEALKPTAKPCLLLSCGCSCVKLIHGASLKGNYKWHWHMQMWVNMRYGFHGFTRPLHSKIMPSFSTASDGCITIIKHHPLCSPLIRSWNFGIYPLNGLSFWYWLSLRHLSQGLNLMEETTNISAGLFWELRVYQMLSLYYYSRVVLCGLGLVDH